MEEDKRMAFDGEAFVDGFNTVWNGHDIEGILAMMTDDVIFEASFGKDPWGSRVVGKPAVREFLEEMFDRVADIRWDEIRHFASPELAVVEWLTTGTPRDATRFEVQGCDLLTLRNGKIAAKRSYRKGQL
jgi:ketosteroid isomerase-like protein